MTISRFIARTFKSTLRSSPVVLAGMAVAATLAVIFGGPSPPPALASLNDPFRDVADAGSPPARHVSSRDGARLSFRHYPGAVADGRGSVVLVHGSSASSHSMHVLAQGFAAAGFDAYALDMRGHGESGHRGHVAYVGQLEHDIEDFMQSVQPAAPTAMVGFSGGGGFALRMASSARQDLFGHYLLLSPFIHQDAPTFRDGAGGWVHVGLPRIMALTVLNQFGITAFNHLPVAAFALNDAARDVLTPTYSYNLSTNFRPRHDWRSDIGAVRQPMAVLAGAEDEAFHADRFAEVFALARPPVSVTLIPDTGHAGLILQPAAIAAAVAALEQLGARTGDLAPQ